MYVTHFVVMHVHSIYFSTLPWVAILTSRHITLMLSQEPADHSCQLAIVYILFCLTAYYCSI